MNDKPIMDFFREYLGKDVDALLWVLSYAAYIHAIDDIIDGDKSDNEFVLGTFELAALIYSNVFYLKNMHILYPLVKMASQTYRDSVILEKQLKEEELIVGRISPDNTWKISVSDSLRQMANEVILACVEVVGGVEKRREASLKMRELSYKFHHTKEGIPC